MLDPEVRGWRHAYVENGSEQADAEQALAAFPKHSKAEAYTS